MFKTFIFAAALAGAATSANAVTNLLVNPSFEDGTPTLGAVTPAGSTDITGWSVFSGGVEVAGPDQWAAADGERSVLLVGDGAGEIGQLIDVEFGGLYELTYSYAADPSVGILGNPAFGLASIAETNFGITFIRTSSDPANPGWLQATHLWVADRTGPVLVSFNAVSDNRDFAVAIDAFSLIEVPEPATWALLIAGFGMVGFSMRRRRVTLTSVTN